jgi:hypothetical protein
MFSHKFKQRMQKKINHYALFFNALKFMLSGKYFDKSAHQPVDRFVVPNEYFGVGVAPGPHPAYDDFVLNVIKRLELNIVRIDVGVDNKEAQIRLMDRLTAEGIALVVHFVQHADEAKLIHRQVQLQRQWAEFVRYVLNRYQRQIHLVEIGSTVNRPRWSGYTLPSFIATWQITYPIVKEFRIPVAGPNITDFEPPYTELFLKQILKTAQLPDHYSNNLFAERATEPERFDHKVMGYQLAGLLKFNLIKKAKTLKQLAGKYALSSVVSLSSFWTLPRIQRYSIFPELKQADYLVRYFILTIASGALDKAFWGPLICHREGLIDDGEEEYAQREKISYYEKVTGQLSRMSYRPSFHAFRFIIKYLSQAEYLGKQGDLNGLEIHRFKKGQQVFDISWCINGLGYSTHQIYSPEAIASAKFYDIRGEQINTLPDFINEQPVMLLWQDIKDAYKPIAPNNALSVQLSRYGYGDYFHLQNLEWQAVISTNLRSQAISLFEFILNLAQSNQGIEGQILRKGRNTIWQLPHPNNPNLMLVLKRPAHQHWHKQLLDQGKSNKSRSAWNASCQLLRRGISVAQPIAFIEHIHQQQFDLNLYVCEAVKHQASVRDLMQSFNQGDQHFLEVSKSRALQQLSQFVYVMHQRGVYYRDLSAGNLLISRVGDSLQFTLIDTNRARFYNHAVSLRQRLSDLVRVCNKLNWPDRLRLLDYYFAACGTHMRWIYRLPFYLYDAKVILKRKVGRKAWRNLLAKLKNKG